MLERALAQLPVAQREAFILREYNGYSYQEIAEITSTTMVTAKTRAWRARERSPQSDRGMDGASGESMKYEI